MISYDGNVIQFELYVSWPLTIMFSDGAEIFGRHLNPIIHVSAKWYYGNFDFLFHIRTCEFRKRPRESIFVTNLVTTINHRCTSNMLRNRVAGSPVVGDARKHAPARSSIGVQFFWNPFSIVEFLLTFEITRRMILMLI